MIDLILLVFIAILGLVYSVLRSQSDTIDENVLWYFWLAIIISVTILIVRALSYLVFNVLFRYIQDRTPSALLRFLVSTLLYLIAAFIILRFVLKENVIALVTASAVVATVAGFALQATLGNLFEGVALQLDQAFHIGDHIQIGDQIGTVEALTWRSIVIRTIDDSLVVIPNGQMTQEQVEVFPADALVRRRVSFPVPVNTPPQKVIEIVDETIDAIPNISFKRSPSTRLVEYDFAEDKTIAMYEIWYYPEDYLDGVITDTIIRKWVWYALFRQGITMATSLPGSEQAQFDMPALVSGREEQIMSNIQLISSVNIFDVLTAEEKRRLAEQANRTMYAPGEPIELSKATKRSMFIVTQGWVKVQPMVTTTDVFGDDFEDTEPDEPDTNGDEEVLISQWDLDELDNITARLSYYIGPIARVLVEDAAQQTVDPFRLYQVLANSISDPDYRSAFLHEAPFFPAIVLETGDYFGEMSLFLRKPPIVAKMEAVGQTELLEITKESIHALSSSNRKLGVAFVQKLQVHQKRSLRGKMERYKNTTLVAIARKQA